MRLTLFILVSLSVQLQAQDFWTAEELDAQRDQLSTQVGGNNAAILDRIIDFEGYFAAMVHREPGPGFSESHDDWADIYFVTSGSASIVTGGEITDAREDSPGEIRGTGIRGGEVQRIGEGDVVHIPTGVPHHVLVGEGEEVTYFILKARAR